jgi:hypothetical protein
MNNSDAQPDIALPVQSPPVNRENAATAPAGQHPAAGVEAARTKCADLTGPARQMCYHAKYGIST